MGNILIGGGSGLIGTRLSELLLKEGHEVFHLGRDPRPKAAYPTFRWDVGKGFLDPEAVQKADYAVNLAGAGIADRRWTKARKRMIIESRVGSTRLMLDAFHQAGKMPKAFVSGAAIGYYGDRGDELLGEDAAPGTGFLSKSCVAWENAIDEVAQAGIRTVAMRTGIVLSPKGGALSKMAFPLNFFIAPYFGSGRQWYSWIHIDDICRCFIYALLNEGISGKYNAVAPNPATNKELMKELVRASGKPALPAPVPAFLLRLIFGEMADTILDSTRVSSQKLEDTGFEFRFPDLGLALEDLYR